MSWSAATTTTVAEVENAVNNLSPNPPSNAVGETAQFTAAQAAAIALVESGAITNPANQGVYVALNGHSNPGHTATAGYAPDSITVSVSQVPQQNTEN